MYVYRQIHLEYSYEMYWVKDLYKHLYTHFRPDTFIPFKCTSC